MEKPRSIRELIDAAGGLATIASAISSNDRFGVTLTADAVRKWQQNGIPDRYWSVILDLTPTTAAEIFGANELARAEKAAA